MAYWLLDVVVLSSVLAVFEIILEKEHGWASGLERTSWGKHVWEGTIIASAFEKPYVTLYHIAMFGGLVPAVLVCQLLLIRYCCLPRAINVGPLGLLTVWQVGSIRFIPILSFVAAWLAISTTEDFLWFAWNWYYPASLRDLFSGKTWWHTHWVTVGNIKVPRFYLSTLFAVSVLLALGAYLAR